MIVKTKRGFYVYTKPNRIGRRHRVGGPYTTYAHAQRINARTKKRKRNVTSKR